MTKNSEELVSLSQMPLGQKGLIVGFSFDTEQGERIQDMGLFPGEQLEIVRLSPEGDAGRSRTARRESQHRILPYGPGQCGD